MASKILSSGSNMAPTPFEWRHLGSGTGLVDHALTPHKPAAPAAVEDTEESIQRRIREQCELAFRQGEAAGRKNAQAEWEDKVQEKMKSLGRAIESAASHKVRLRQEAERDVVDLALAVARRILRRQIQVDEDAILGLVKAAFETASLREITHVRVHPQFVAIVRNHLDSVGAPASIQLAGDGSLELGGVILETARGSLDASAETQLDEISRGFADTMSLTRRRS